MIVITVARKPVEGTVSSNVLKHGTGALNINASRISFESEADAEKAHDNALGPIERYKTKRFLYGQKSGGTTAGFEDNFTQKGRWPANVILSDSAEVLAGFPQTSSNSGVPFSRNPDKSRTSYGAFAGRDADEGYYGDSGSAARFFKQVKK